MPYITHPSGQRTFYYDDNFADPWTPTETILIHHGWGRNSNFWYKWIPILAQKYRVIRRDALGHGYSGAPPKGHPKTIDSLLDEIVDTLDQLKIDKVHYLGESTGGIFGEFLAARNPERLHSLTICATPLYLPESAQKSLAVGYSDPIAAIRALGMRSWGKAALPILKTADNAPPGYVSWWLDQFSIPTTEGVCAYTEIICRKDFDANRIIDKINVPMLLLSPEHSVLVSLEDQRRLAQTVKGAHIEIIAGDGHEIYLSQASACQQKFLDFLRAVMD